MYKLIPMIIFSFGFAETLEIYYNSNAHIYGFQFNVDSVIVKSASGGDAAIHDFMISNSSTTVLGFSLVGSFIPAGEGVLVILDVEGGGASIQFV